MATPLTEDQQNKVNRLLEAEKRGILSQRPELEKRLKIMRDRGIVAPSPFQLVDTTPIPFDEAQERARAVIPVPGPADQPIQMDEELLDTRRARAQAGIEEDRLGFIDNFKLGLSLNPTKELKTVLDNKFKSDIPIRFDSTTGKYQYVNPKTNRITNVGIEGLDVGDVGKLAGEAPVAAGDIAGTIAGGAGRRSPIGAVAGESAGAAVGTYVGEFTRLALGKLLGVNQDVSFEDINDSALKKAGIALGATAAIGTLSPVGKSISNFIQGRNFTKDAAIRAGLQSQEADQVLETVNDILQQSGSSSSVRLTTGKRTGDPILLGDEAVVRREKDFVMDFIERDKADQDALVEAFDLISPTRRSDAGGVIEKFGSDKTRRLAKAKDALNTSARNLESQLDAITPAEKITSGDIVRSAISDKRVAVNNKVKAVNNQWRRLAGFNQNTNKSQVQIPIGDRTANTIAELKQEAKDAIFRVTKDDRQGLFNMKAGKEVDLIDYQRAISDLRSTIRAADKGESVSQGQQTVLKRTLSSLVKDRDNFLRKNDRDDLFFAIRNADEFTRNSRSALDRSVAGDLMRKQGGRLKVRSQDVFDTAFVKGGDEQSRELFNVIGDNKEAVNAWRTEILNKYRADVFPEGRTRSATVKAHDRFMDDFSGAMRPFFSKQEMEQIGKVGGLVKVVEKQENQYQNIIKVLNGGKLPKAAGGNVVAKTRNLISSLDPEEVVPWVIRDVNKGPGRARRLVKLLESEPGVLEGLRSEARLSLRNKVMPEGKILDPARFDSEIKKNAQTYRALFGDEYVDNLFTINDVLQLSKRAAPTLREKETVGIETAIARATVAPPLTREGRLLTAFMRFRSKQAKTAIANALLNPEDLNEIARLSVASKTSRQASEIAASLGLLEFIDEEQ